MKIILRRSFIKKIKLPFEIKVFKYKLMKPLLYALPLDFISNNIYEIIRSPSKGRRWQKWKPDIQLQNLGLKRKNPHNRELLMAMCSLEYPYKSVDIS